MQRSKSYSAGPLAKPQSILSVQCPPENEPSGTGLISSQSGQLLFKGMASPRRAMLACGFLCDGYHVRFGLGKAPPGRASFRGSSLVVVYLVHRPFSRSSFHRVGRWPTPERSRRTPLSSLLESNMHNLVNLSLHPNTLSTISFIGR